MTTSQAQQATEARKLTRRYLDHAATSWPKPPIVFEAWEHAARVIGGTVGRGGYNEARQANAIAAGLREQVAILLGGVDRSRVAFSSGATLSLNMAIHGLLKPGDHVIATAADHNATLRPLHWLKSRGLITTTIVPCDGVGFVDPQSIANAWRPETKLVVCSHASNVTGTLQDAAAIAGIAHSHGGLLLLDAAQSLGQVPFVDAAFAADIVVAPSHKWLLGPAGAGILWVRSGIELDLLLQGGTGTNSESLDMPASFLERMEPGTPDLPALAGLSAAIDWLFAQSIPAVGVACRAMADRCAERLRQSAGVRVFRQQSQAPGGLAGAPIVSFTLDGYDPAEIAVVLEDAAGVQVRSGFHCAALVHGALGMLSSSSKQSAGTVRLSFGPFNGADDIDAVVETIEKLAASVPVSLARS